MILRAFVCLIFISCAVAFSPRGLLGTKECAWGPSFWCGNVTNAKNCHAVKHCIQTVWEHQKVSEDNDDICTLCKNMVLDARNQLESKETVDEIKEVFEGSCRLMHLKPIVKTCIQFADEYVPELVDMLSSQMNPDVICTLAGLCNNAAIDKMLEDVNNKKIKDEKRTSELQTDCEKCLDFADTIRQKIEKAGPGDLKAYLMEKCRSFGSLSDSCANLVDEYIDDIYNKLKKDFDPSALCYLSSSCVNGYRRKVQVKTESDVGVIHVNSDAISVAVKHLSADQTCELCKTLVKHLKDVLVSNTTEEEFKQVLKGFCRQTGKFKSECLALADEYYEKLYETIVNDLDGVEVCSFAGICTKPGAFINGPVSPMLPEAAIPIKKGMLTGDDEAQLGRVSVVRSDSGVKVFTPVVQSPVKVEISYGDPLESKFFQLPIERMTLPHAKDLNVNNQQSCVFCQYLLHYIQKAISQPYGERALKEAVDKVCDVLPHSVTLECRNFVEQFGDAFVAILAQEIDPSQVCPSLRICPARVLENEYEPLELGGKPGCPLCLMAVEDVIEKLKDNKTEDSVRTALRSLCVKMPKNLRNQCDEFVQDYTAEVIDLILADFTPQEVCTYLKICHANVEVELVAPLSEEKHEVLTNEIPRGHTEEHLDIRKKTPPMCFLCEFVMDKIKNELKDNRTEEEIEKALIGICRRMPKSVKADCFHFVHEYGKYIVELLVNEEDPKVVCREMHMCREQEEGHEIKIIRRAVEECAICEALVGAVRGLLEDKDFDRNISHYATKICYTVPHMRHNQMEKCISMITSYGPSIVNLLVEFEVRPALVCPRLGLCDGTEQAKVDLVETTTMVPPSNPQQRPHLLGGNSCTWGPAYWCQSEDHAKECGTLAHCREMVWKADRPTPAA